MKTYPHLLEATGITIEKIRKERKMTKTALADFSDLQDCYVRGIIKGKRNPTITAISMTLKLVSTSRSFARFTRM